MESRGGPVTTTPPPHTQQPPEPHCPCDLTAIDRAQSTEDQNSWPTVGSWVFFLFPPSPSEKKRNPPNSSLTVHPELVVFLQSLEVTAAPPHQACPPCCPGLPARRRLIPSVRPSAGYPRVAPSESHLPHTCLIIATG